MEPKIDQKVSIFSGITSYDEASIQAALASIFLSLGLDTNNPFGKYIQKGNTVLIKPNWVRDINPLGHNIDSLITHSTLIKVLLEYIAVGLEGYGRIVIGDAPLQNCNFDKLLEKTHIMDAVTNFKSRNPNIEVEVEDWRLTTLNRSKESPSQTTKNYDLDKYELVDLGKDSFLEDISEKADRFRVTKYKPSLLRLHHGKGKHEYLVTKRIFEADFIINLPKFKTHIKAGITGALKNLVGINGHKEFLPHHIKGSSEEGGDNYRNKNYIRAKYEDMYDYVWENFNNFPAWKKKFYLRLLRTLEVASFTFGKEAITAGSWYGNDTIWRTTLDLNHTLYFKGKSKKVLNIVDGVIAGEGKGPLEPQPKNIGMIIAGEHPGLVDACIAQMIGYDASKIKTIKNTLDHSASKFRVTNWMNSEVIIFEKDGRNNTTIQSLPNLKLKKPPYWENI